MSQEKFITDDSPHVTITECGGNLVIRGSSESAVYVKGDGTETTETENDLSVRGARDLKLMVPENATITIMHVHGDLVIKGITGSVTLQEVSGDAILSSLNDVKINTIHSDISVKNLDGSLNVEEIHGDVVLRNVMDINIHHVHGDLSARFVNGAIHIKQSMGDIGLRTVNGDITIEHGARDVSLRNLAGKNVVKEIQGDIRLYGGLSAGDHTFAAERDIIVRWPYSEPINLSATAPKIANRLTLEKEVETENTLTGRIGDGETNVTLTANGRIILKESQIVDKRWEGEFMDAANFTFDLDVEGFSEQINQFTQKIGDHISQFSTDLETKFGPEFTEKIARKAEQAAAKAAKAAERARQQAERRARAYGRPPTPPRPKRRKASSDEQIKILKMVEQGIITPDEAATLLEALEK